MYFKCKYKLRIKSLVYPIMKVWILFKIWLKYSTVLVKTSAIIVIAKIAIPLQILCKVALGVLSRRSDL